MPATQTATHPASLVVGPRDGRTPAPLNVVGEAVLVKLAGSDTSDRFAFFHLTAPPTSGPPLHQHTREDELFYVLEGELTFQIDGKRSVAKAGTTVYARRLTVHTYQNFGPGTAKLLIVVSPAGAEHLFEEMSAAPPDPAVLGEINKKYGVNIMGPPLLPSH